ncbi:MAG: MATE family efflux transporter [bacterium]|nr:MATE family efflux transporter [bacterium]
MKLDMTKGSINRHLIRFAIPLILGNMFQLTYNAVDSIIVGRYIGNEAQAAVGTANPLMNIIVFFIVGACTGIQVLMSTYFGAKQEDKLRKEISTSIIIGFLFVFVLSVASIIFAKPLLMLIQVPKSILSMSTTYLQIIFAGLVFTFLYNIYAAILRSIGDSKTPIYFIIISCLINVGLDIVFVVYGKMGVKGVAYATVIAELVSSILCILYVRRRVPLLRIPVKEFRVEKDMVRDTISFGMNTAIQKIALNVGKVLVQGCVNTLDIDAIATFNAVSRVDDYVFQPEQSIGNAMTTCIAQNNGAKKEDRIQKTLHKGLILELIYWVFIGTIIYFVAEKVMYLFVNDTENNVVSMGTSYLKTMAFFYVMPALTNGIQGYFRGLGKLNINFYSTLIQMIGRVVMAYILVPRLGVFGISLSCFIGWVVMLGFEVPYYFYYRRKQQMISEHAAC